jgi:hypothetical protein
MQMAIDDVGRPGELEPSSPKQSNPAGGYRSVIPAGTVLIGSPLPRRIVSVQGALLEILRRLIAVRTAFLDNLRAVPAIVVPGGARTAAPVRIKRTPYQQRQQQPQHAREQHDETHYMHVDAMRLSGRHGVTQDSSEGDQRDARAGTHDPPAHWLARPARHAHCPALSPDIQVAMPTPQVDLSRTALRMVI